MPRIGICPLRNAVNSRRIAVRILLNAVQTDVRFFVEHDELLMFAGRRFFARFVEIADPGARTQILEYRLG
jgi:hypothetical protein